MIDDAVREIGETSKALIDFEGTVNGAFRDGVIEQAEAKAIEKYINTLNTEKADADAVYTKLYSNIYLLGTPKTDLLNSKITYNGAHTNLIKAVNDAITDGRTTVAEKNNVDSKFTAYKNAIADYKSKVEAANKAIQDTLKSYSDEALAKGKEAFTAASNAQASANQAQQSVSGLGNYIDGAFSDGIIQESEAKAIEKYINTVKTDKAAVEATYNKLYVNSYLTGTAKSGLLNAKVTLFGAIDNLLSAINSAISDGKTTVAEKNNVDSKFSLFNSAMSSFNTAVETANKAIQDTLKSYSDNAASNVPDSFKDSLAQRLGYTNYAALEAAADAGNTVIKDGKVNTVLLEAEAIVTKGLTAAMIQALDIVTNRLTVTSGAKIGNFTIEDGWLKSTTQAGTGKGYISVKTGVSDISFGEDLMPATAGGAYTLTGLIENKKSNQGEYFGQENENIALKVSAKNATANWALDCFGGIRKVGRGIDINEPYIMKGNAMADLLETKIKYYNYFLLQPPKGYNVIVRLPSYTLLNSKFGGLPNGNTISLGITSITLAVQAGFEGRIVLVGVKDGILLGNSGVILNDFPISGYNYGTLGLTQCNIVKLGQFNGGWIITYLSR